MNELSFKITKAGQNSGIIVHATLIDNNIEYSNVIFSDYIHEMFNNQNNFNNDEYMGPDFQTLDEKLQEELQNYFESLGVNSELASFVQVLTVDKDQRLYLNWLKEVNKFI
jgi:complement component 1 Q subcomponent-binding protein